MAESAIKTVVIDKDKAPEELASYTQLTAKGRTEIAATKEDGEEVRLRNLSELVLRLTVRAGFAAVEGAETTVRGREKPDTGGGDDSAKKTTASPRAKTREAEKKQPSFELTDEIRAYIDRIVEEKVAERTRDLQKENEDLKAEVERLKAELEGFRSGTVKPSVSPETDATKEAYDESGSPFMLDDRLRIDGDKLGRVASHPYKNGSGDWCVKVEIDGEEREYKIEELEDRNIAKRRVSPGTVANTVASGTSEARTCPHGQHVSHCDPVVVAEPVCTHRPAHHAGCPETVAAAAVIPAPAAERSVIVEEVWYRRPINWIGAVAAAAALTGAVFGIWNHHELEELENAKPKIVYVGPSGKDVPAPQRPKTEKHHTVFFDRRAGHRRTAVRLPRNLSLARNSSGKLEILDGSTVIVSAEQMPKGIAKSPGTLSKAATAALHERGFTVGYEPLQNVGNTNLYMSDVS